MKTQELLNAATLHTIAILGVAASERGKELLEQRNNGSVRQADIRSRIEANDDLLMILSAAAKKVKEVPENS